MSDQQLKCSICNQTYAGDPKIAESTDGWHIEDDFVMCATCQEEEEGEQGDWG